MDIMKRLINVSNRLPVSLKGDSVILSSGGLVSALEGVRNNYDMAWVGWAGGYPENESDKKRLQKTLREKHGFEPVFLTPEWVDGYYNRFSNSSLWPLLHYMIPYSHYEESWFEDYRRVNGIFAEKVSRLAERNGLVWIHDYI
jgi:trehalose 6-phosphate synthase/phosphatase